MISFRKLQVGKEYYIKKHDTDRKFKFVFDEYRTGEYNDLLKDEDLFMIFRRDTHRYAFYANDYYYDPEKIKRNAQRAIEQMEHRSMNMVLKRLVNEEFEWS
jgi:hypothetical protein|uniref:Uncharacterized protein n=1 Tax=viral metagenome TaxID=1070528 RepID=A0A6C0D3L9_9ZZZZ